ncbi:MAG: gliding motility-associated C-terminal domain-containing protein [Flavisolibacter sp.]|nr:gliding motility-associated C-terminal domain-containing protein [Flavisolibacter sp.]
MVNSQNQCLSNNKIELKPSICSGYVALLEGSLPSGGNGSYTYIWQKNENDCGEKDFVDIPGATGRNYSIPKPNDVSGNGMVCYRRIVVSGNCQDESIKVQVQLKQNPDVIAWKADVTVQPTCKETTGTIVVSGPTGGGFEYNLDGGAYQPSTTFTGVSPGVHTITLRNSADPACISQPVSVTVNEPPKPTGTITPGTASICPGSSATLTATGGAVYQWSLNGAAINGATAATYNATQPGTYSVVIIIDKCNAPASNTAIITEAPVPSGVISPATTTLCAGGTQVLSATGGASYQWYKDGVAISGATSATYTATQAGNYSADLISSAGCKGKTSNSATVTINPAVTFTTSTTDANCTSPSGSITVNPAGGTGNGYSYSKDNGVTFQPENTFKNLPTGNYQIVVKDAAGCKSAPATVSIKLIGTTLNATATVVDIGCVQTTGSATIAATGGTAPYTYSIDGGSFGAAATFTNLTAGAHKATVKDAAGCTFDISFTIKQTSTSPNLVITNSPALCAGSVVNLKAPSITAGSDAGLTYTYWADAAATSALANPTSVGAGTYYIKGTNGGGCSVIKPVTITISTVPAGTIKPANPSIACTGESIALTASSGTSYQWFRNDSIINGATEATYKATEAGNYAVSIINGTCAGLASNTVKVRFQACSPITETKVFVPTAFTPNNNSTNDFLQPYFINIRELVYFKVFNRWGQLVFQTNTIGKGWDGTFNGIQQPTEIYTWILECIDNNGKTIRQSGRSLLLR